MRTQALCHIMPRVPIYRARERQLDVLDSYEARFRRVFITLSSSSVTRRLTLATEVPGARDHWLNSLSDVEILFEGRVE